MRRSKFLILAVILLSILSFSTTIKMYHITDYHSHAIPFYSEGQHGFGGIARIITYLREKSVDENTLIFCGGDMINLGTPAWSDKFHAIELPWFNNVFDAMAFGNHDSEYGAEDFTEVWKQLTYPILGGNILDANGSPVFEYLGKRYLVFEVEGKRIGVFALAGSDYDSLVKPAARPLEGATFGDFMGTATEIVEEMKAEEVDLIVFIGHAEYEETLEMARKVEGIDLIFGTHSHLKIPLTKIDGTDTYFISPYQYGTYAAEVVVYFGADGKKIISGSLVPMDSSLPEDTIIAGKVERLKSELESDPAFAHLFEWIGEVETELSASNVNTGESVLGNFVMDVIREASGANVALSTSSSFRASIAPGSTVYEDLKNALPYVNIIYVYEVKGDTLEKILNHSISQSGTGFFSQVSGVRFVISDGKSTAIEVQADLECPDSFEPLNFEKTYLVATTNYQGLFAPGYKDLFAGLKYTDTGLDVQKLVKEYMQNNSPVRAALDGRIIK
jgi:5'-nucleotidase